MKDPRQSGQNTGNLPEAERFTETLLNNLPGMAYRCLNDQFWTMTFVSGGCESLTGYKQEYILGKRLSWVEMMHSDDQAAARQTVSSALASGRQFDIQYRIKDKLGQHKWVREQGCGVYASDGTVEAIEGYVDDITLLKRSAQSLADTELYYEEEVRKKQEQLAHADRLNTLGEMATGIAHEINQPLTAISLFAQTGRRLFEAGTYDKLPEIFDKLSQHSRRAGAIVERMQDMARRKESSKQIVDLNALIEGVMGLAEVDARSSEIVIEFNRGVKLPNVEVDVVQVQQVTLNLLRNGMDAMRSTDCRNGSTILLTTRSRDDGLLEVAVTDSGCGVSDQVAEALFDSFLTTKSTGLGMGLPISKAIVTAHGGQLQFRNNDDCGATFLFTLPPVAQGRQDG